MENKMLISLETVQILEIPTNKTHLALYGSK